MTTKWTKKPTGYDSQEASRQRWRHFALQGRLVGFEACLRSILGEDTTTVLAKQDAHDILDKLQSLKRSMNTRIECGQYYEGTKPENEYKGKSPASNSSGNGFRPLRT